MCLYTLSLKHSLISKFQLFRHKNSKIMSYIINISSRIKLEDFIKLVWIHNILLPILINLNDKDSVTFESHCLCQMLYYWSMSKHLNQIQSPFMIKLTFHLTISWHLWMTIFVKILFTKSLPIKYVSHILKSSHYPNKSCRYYYIIIIVCYKYYKMLPTHQLVLRLWRTKKIFTLLCKLS